MKKGKRDIISVIIILLVMALIFLGVYLATKERESDKEPVDIWLDAKK